MTRVYIFIDYLLLFKMIIVLIALTGVMLVATADTIDVFN